MSNRRKWWHVCRGKTFALFVALAAGYLGARLSFSQDTPAGTAAAPTTASTEAAPELPGWMTPDPSKEGSPLPDPGGSSSGVAITPASDGKGDVPSKMTSGDL